MRSESSEEAFGGIESLARDMLAEARTLVACGWCQGTSARAKDHQPVVPWADAAREWSALGALAGSWHRGRSPTIHRAADDPVFDAYVVAAKAFTDVVHQGPQSWNDDSRRRADDVVSALDRALRAVAPAARGLKEHPVLVRTSRRPRQPRTTLA
jgi:hypothetical protein